MARTISVAGRLVGPGHPCFIIAEAGINHNGDLELAKRLIEVAAEAGADAVKFQTFRTELLVTSTTPLAPYQAANLGKTTNQAEMLKSLELAPEDFQALSDYARAKGLVFLSTPFDIQSADFLETLGVPAYKVPSGELTNTELLRHLARKGKPLIISTGMATLAEVETAVQAVEECGNHEYVLLHCVSNYPADPREVNLRAMRTLRSAFDALVGYSDHTSGVCVAVAAVALGGCVVEKHFTLDKTLPGPDHKASADPNELRELIACIRQVEQALGDGRKRPARSELDTMAAARKSLVAACNLPPGVIIEEAHLTLRRPGTGLPPAMKSFVLGRKTKCYIAAGSLLTLDMVA